MTLQEALAECRRERLADPSDIWDGETITAYWFWGGRSAQVLANIDASYLEIHLTAEPSKYFRANSPETATLVHAEQVLHDWNVPIDAAWFSPKQLIERNTAQQAADPNYQQLLTALQAVKALGYSRDDVMRAWDSIAD